MSDISDKLTVKGLVKVKKERTILVWERNVCETILFSVNFANFVYLFFSAETSTKKGEKI